MQETVGQAIAGCRYRESVHVGIARAAENLHASQPYPGSNNSRVKLAQPSNRAPLQVEIV